MDQMGKLVGTERHSHAAVVIRNKEPNFCDSNWSTLSFLIQKASKNVKGTRNEKF